jgi:hypothetical protein
MIALGNLTYQNLGRVSDATPFDCLIRCASGSGAGKSYRGSTTGMLRDIGIT